MAYHKALELAEIYDHLFRCRVSAAFLVNEAILGWHEETAMHPKPKSPIGQLLVLAIG